MIRTAVVLVVLLQVGPAHADPAAALLKQAKQAHTAADFQRAIELLHKAVDATTEPETLGKIHLQLGLNHLALGKRDDASGSFRTALTFNPTLTLDPGKHATEVLERLRKVRQTMKGTLVVEANEVNALVILDGEPVGKTPYRAPAVIGAHQLEVHSANGKRRRERRVVVAQGQESRIAITLPEPSGRLWTWVAAGGAVAALATAVGLSVAASAGYDDYRGTMDLSRREDLRDSVEARNLGAYVLYGVAGALAAGAGALFWVEGR